jgi:RHS repeat-associated protein
MVEQQSGSNYELLYSPAGLLGWMQGQTVTSSKIPIPGDARYDIYSNAGRFEHRDWLGSTRVVSNNSRAVTDYSSYAPFGETYLSSNGLVHFAGMDRQTASTTWDADARRQNANQGRWLSPDPGGLSVVDPSKPQTWNRYAYVANNPIAFVDPLGLFRSDAVGSGDDGCYLTFSCTVYTDSVGMQIDSQVAEQELHNGSGVICPQCAVTAVNGAGFAFPSVGADDSISWSFSFAATNKGVSLTDAALAEMLGLPTVLTATAFSRQQETALVGALGDLFHRIKYGKCAAFYGGQGSDPLQTFGGNIIFGPMSRPAIGGTPTGDGMILNSDPNGAFLSPPPSFYGAVGSTQVRSFIIAHELAHIVIGMPGFFTNDNPAVFGAAGAARQTVNNLRVSSNCY